MSVEITVEPAPTTPVITVNPAGEVTCTVTYSELTEITNNPGGDNGWVQVRDGTGFAGIEPDTEGNVLTVFGGEWVSATPAAGAMADPGSNGVVVRTALNTTAARTITAGTNVSVTNGSGVSGNPTINVPDASTSVKGAVELAADGEAASGLAVQSNDARLSNARTPTAHASTHVTGGADKIRDATASQDGLMTTAYASKLDGITGINTGDVTIDATLADVATVTGQVLSADDLGSDKLWGWDESAGKVVGFTLGTNLTVSDTTINASGGGTPGGTDTQVQFNDGGVFGGDAGLTYDKTTDTLSATNLTVSGLSTLNHIHGSIAGNLYVHVKNASGVTIAKGTPVYATDTVGASGQIEVAAADYTNSAKMPAIGITDAQLIANAEGNAVVVGEVMELATDSYTINQELFVGTAGLLSALPTTGEAQSIAVVSRVHASTGIIIVNAQARLNAALRALASNVGSGLTALNASNITSGSLADAYIASAATWNAKQDAGSYITALTGDVTASGPGSVAATIANNAVTYAKIQDVTAASRLLGRGDSGSGDPQEITLGTGLAMTGTTLSATGSGSGDMTKAVYDPQGLFVITGQPGSDDGLQTGGLGGFLRFEGGNAGAQPGENGGAAGTFTANGGNGSSNSVGGTGGSINTDASSIYRGGNINTSATGTSDGGDITTSGGGSIDTAGTGSIGLGAAGTRTTIQGAAVAPWTLTLPTGAGSAGQYLKTDGFGTTSWDSPGGAGTVTSVAISGTDGIEVDSGSPITASGTIQLGVNAATMKTTLDLTGTNSGDVTLAGTPDYITISGQTITRNPIDLAADVTGILPIANIATGTPDGTKFVRDDGTLATPAGSGTVTSVGGTGTVNGITLSGTVTSAGNLTLGGTLSGVDLTTQVTGTLPVSNGGTGQTTAVAAFDALAPTTTKGDLIVHNGTDNIRVAVGATNGHVLTVDSAEASGVKWAAGGGGGGGPPAAIEAIKTDTFTFTNVNETWADVPGLSVTITPSSTSKKVRLDITLNGSVSGSHAIGFRVLRGATAVGIGDANGSRLRGTGQIPQNISSFYSASTTVTFTDSPASTSALTYKIQVTNLSGGAATGHINRTNTDANATYTLNSISVIRVQEVD